MGIVLILEMVQVFFCHIMIVLTFVYQNQVQVRDTNQDLALFFHGIVQMVVVLTQEMVQDFFYHIVTVQAFVHQTLVQDLEVVLAQDLEVVLAQVQIMGQEAALLFHGIV